METTKGYLYIDLKTAQEYFKQGGLHKEIALKSGYTEADLNPIRNEWEDRIIAYGTKFVSGWYLGGNSVYKETNEENIDRSTFKTEKQAKSAFAYAQLTQLMALPEYNGDWVPYWSDDDYKYSITRCKNEIITDCLVNYYNQIVFKTEKIRDKFLENNLDLLKEYFELY